MNNKKKGMNPIVEEKNNPEDDVEKDLKEEFKLIQVNIANWIRNSLFIKNWAITTWGLLTAFLLSQYYSSDYNINSASLLWFLIIIPLPFWLFDALFKEFERIAIARSRAIHDRLTRTLTKIDHKTKKEYRKILEKDKTYKNNKKILKNKLKNKIKSNPNLVFKKELNKELYKIIQKSMDGKKKIFEKNFPTFDPVGSISCKNYFYRAKYLRLTKFWRCFIVRIVSTIYLMLIIFSFIIITYISWIISSLISCIIGISGVILLSIILGIIWYKCEKWKI